VGTELVGEDRRWLRSLPVGDGRGWPRQAGDLPTLLRRSPLVGTSRTLKVSGGRPPGGRGAAAAARCDYGRGSVLDLDMLPRPEAIALLRRRAPGLTDDHADGLAEVLGDLPLALEQAAAYLEQT
jgi:hypothetical protein